MDLTKMKNEGVGIVKGAQETNANTFVIEHELDACRQRILELQQNLDREKVTVDQTSATLRAKDEEISQLTMDLKKAKGKESLLKPEHVTALSQLQKTHGWKWIFRF